MGDGAMYQEKKITHARYRTLKFTLCPPLQQILYSASAVKRWNGI